MQAEQEESQGTSEETRKPRNVELTERDVATLRFIGEQYAVRFDQLQRVLGMRAGGVMQHPGLLSESATRVWLARMKAVEAIEMQRPYGSQPAYLWPTITGLHLAALDYRPLRPAPATLMHLYWITQTRLYLATKRPTDRWIPERQLRSEQHARRSHNEQETPDAQLITAKGPLAIEVELSIKQTTRLVNLLRRRASEYYTVWYFCAEATFVRVEAAKKELPAELRERIQLYPLKQVEQGGAG